MAVSEEFQKRMVELTEDLDCKKSEVPTLLGINYATFSRAVNYGIVPMTRVLIKIADFFDVSIEYLLAKTDDSYFAKASNPQSFFERLDSLKNSKNLTYYSLGQKLHFGANFFSEWKRKGHLPSLDYLFLLADFFEVSIDYLLGRTDDIN